MGKGYSINAVNFKGFFFQNFANSLIQVTFFFQYMHNINGDYGMNGSNYNNSL